MDELIVADAGPLIALGQVDALAALARMYRSVIVPHAVRIECVGRPDKPAAVAIERAFALGLLAPAPTPATPSPPARRFHAWHRS